MVRLAALDAHDAARPPAPSVRTGTGPDDGESTGSGPAAGRTAVAVEERGAGEQRPELGDAVGVGPGRTARRRIRRSAWYLVVGCLCLAAALVVAVTTFASNRQPGQSITGTFAQSQAQQIEEDLAQAATDENQGQGPRAAQLYQSVLDGHPDNEVALAQLGWLEYQTGRSGDRASLMADARAKLLRAVRLDPGDYAARLYLGTLLLQRDGDATGAVAQYRRFLADGPPPALVAQAAPEIRAAFTAAGLPVPPPAASG